MNRTSSHRNAMFRNMVTSLFKHDRIKTTDAKAKELKQWADHLITLAKRGDLHARRQALAIVREKDVVHKLFGEAPERFSGVSGGYTRTAKVGRRHGDAAMLTLIELMGPAGKGVKKKKPVGKRDQIATPEKDKPQPEQVKPEIDKLVAKPETIQPIAPSADTPVQTTEETPEDKTGGIKKEE